MLQRMEFWEKWQECRLLSSNLAGVVDIPQHRNHMRDEFKNIAQINWQSFLYSQDDFKSDSLANPKNVMDKVRSNYSNLKTDIEILIRYICEKRLSFHARWPILKADTVRRIFEYYDGALKNMQGSLGEAYDHIYYKLRDLIITGRLLVLLMIL